METEIKRVRFFDGQFLKEVDFQDEQRYHQHLRRRMNFLLFGGSGVVSMTPSDLTLAVVSAGDKTFQVRAGMAIGRNTLELEGREVLLLGDSAPIDLDTSGVVAGQTATVTIHYEEQTAKDPPSEGDVDEDTRSLEVAVIAVHAGAPPATTAAGDPYIVLGAIDYDTMTVTTAGRQLAQLRASLIGAPPAPAITAISVGTGLQGTSFTANISGTDLTGASAVTFSGSGVTAAINAGGTSTNLPVTITVAAAATLGAHTFTVTTTGGTAGSTGIAAASFAVGAPLPTVTSISAASALQGDTLNLSIGGTNLTGASAVTFSGSGVTAAITTITPTSIAVTVSVAAAAAAGLRTFTVTTPGGAASSAGVPAAAFTINAAVPTLTAISVNTIADGATLSATITGVNLGGATAVAFSGSGVSAAISGAVTPTSIPITITVTAAATLGARTFTVTTPIGSPTSSGAGGQAFTVVAAPTVSGITPIFGSRSGPQPLNATIAGANLLGATAVTFSGTGVTATIGGGGTATSLPVSITLAGSAATGARTFTVSTPGGGTASGSFTVTA
jgi:hypothetical protein